jgi:hypothetical protein
VFHVQCKHVASTRQSCKQLSLGWSILNSISSLSGHVLFESVYPGSDATSSHAYISRSDSVGDSVGAFGRVKVQQPREGAGWKKGEEVRKGKGRRGMVSCVRKST